MSDFIQRVTTFLTCFPFSFQETNSLSNYQFLFQDLAITTLIGVTSKTFLKLSWLFQKGWSTRRDTSCSLRDMGLMPKGLFREGKRK